MNETQVKLLERGVMIMPSEIDHAAYEYVLEALLEMQGRQVRLFCRGDGGETRPALAIVDLIRQHGQVIGMLAGEADSSHVPVWAACDERYVYPHGAIGVHQVSIYVGIPIDATHADLMAKEARRQDAMTAELLASISNKPVGYWSDLISDTGSGGLHLIGAKRLIQLGMAKPISELDADPLRANGHREGAF